jgi:hypothetical protein
MAMSTPAPSSQTFHQAILRELTERHIAPTGPTSGNWLGLRAQRAKGPETRPWRRASGSGHRGEVEGSEPSGSLRRPFSAMMAQKREPTRSLHMPQPSKRQPHADATYHGMVLEGGGFFHAPGNHRNSALSLV